MPINSGNFVNSVFHNQKISWFGTIRRGPSNTYTNLLISTTNDTGAGCNDINLPLSNEGIYQLTPNLDSSLIINNVILNSNSGINYSSAIVTTTIECLTSNIENNLVENVIPFIYPNPSHDVFFLKGMQLNSKVKISIYNTLGILIYSESKKDLFEYSIDLSKFSNGVYFVKVITNLGIQYSLKLLKIAIHNE